MSLESKFPYTKEDFVIDSSYALCILSYISPLTLGMYRGITIATNIDSNSQLLTAFEINLLGVSTLALLNTQEKKIKYASLGALSAGITAPLLYGIGYEIGYIAGKIIY
jgi:hypothetical protein